MCFWPWAGTAQDSNPGGDRRVSLLHACPSRLALVPSCAEGTGAWGKVAMAW